MLCFEKKDPENVTVLMLTTSFPVRTGMVSGSFIHSLVCHLTRWVNLTVVTPAPNGDFTVNDDARYQLVCFRYSLKKWQNLAHQPGGIPVALSQDGKMFLLLPLFIVSEFFYCWKYSRKSDLIHANWSFNGAVAGMVGAITRIPVVTTLRGTDVSKAQISLVDKILLKISVALSDKVIGVSRSITDYVTSEFPKYREKLTLISNGVDPRLTYLPLPTGESEIFRILTIGNLVPNKGVHLIIEALGILRDPNIVLQVVGDGIEREHLQHNASVAGVGNAVTFVGSIPPDSVIEKYQEADLLILASYSEGRPNVILEGMAAGVPIIASDIESVCELIENDARGLLFNKGDSQHLARQILGMRSDLKSRIRYAESAREYIIKNGLLWTETAKCYAELYTSMLPQNESKCAG